MNVRILTALLSALLFLSCANKKEHSLPFIMDMVHNNPGEVHQTTKYTNPTYLEEAGYNAVVPQWHVQCGLTYDSYEKGIVPEGSQEREWILKRQHEIKEKLKEAKSAGLQVYPFTDMFVSIS